MGNTQTKKALSQLTLSVQKLDTANPLPGVHSCCWARSGDYLLIIGGRINGFHGLNENTLKFGKEHANHELIVIDFSTLTHKCIPIATSSPHFFQFTSSNAQFVQDGDTLYIAGGFGRKSLSDDESGTTLSLFTAVSVSKMINAILSNGNPDNAVMYSLSSATVQVTGGEMCKEGDTFYLMFGQNYDHDYEVGITGHYTNAVRPFKVENGQIINFNENKKDFLHRRDLNVEKVYSSDKALYVGYGGVFKSNGDGYTNPVYIYPQENSTSVFNNPEIEQITNNYSCPILSVYNGAENVNTHFLIGGIGQYQYHQETGSWENGDMGALLPFVNIITRMEWIGNELSQTWQLPPNEPLLPELMGANAIFFPLQRYLYHKNCLDYNLLVTGSNMVGYIIGGIKSPRPTSSRIYPTALNNQVYAVYLQKS